MDEKHFQRAFKKYLNQEIQDVDLWKQIEGTLPMASGRAARTSLRLSKVALVALLLTLTAVAAYAFYQELIVAGDPGITSVGQAELLTPIDETRTVQGPFAENNLTVTLDFAYADANRITIGYTVHGESPTGARMMAYSNPRLTTADGRPVDRLLLLADQQAQDQPAEGEFREFSSTLTTSFITGDIGPSEGEAQSLNLRLLVEVALANLDSGGFPAPEMMMAGMTEFEFSVPFIESQVIDIGQSSEAAERTVDLQQASITPSMTRLDLCYELPPVELVPGWSPVITLAVDGEVVFTGQTETYGMTDRYDLNDRCRSVVIPLALQDRRPGEWQLEILEFRDLGGAESAITGPWKFTFMAPSD